MLGTANVRRPVRFDCLRVAVAALLIGVCTAPAVGSSTAAPTGEIVFASDRDWLQPGEIYVARPGAQPRDISNSVYEDVNPAVAPRGDEIAFWSVRSGQWQLYEAHTDGSDLRAVTGTEQTAEQYPQAPFFSADGRTLIVALVVQLTDDTYQQEVLDADVASAAAQAFLTSCPGPEPSPDASLVACRPSTRRHRRLRPCWNASFSRRGHLARVVANGSGGRIEQRGLPLRHAWTHPASLPRHVRGLVVRRTAPGSRTGHAARHPVRRRARARDLRQREVRVGRRAVHPGPQVRPVLRR